jgi:hypothetical protein
LSRKITPIPLLATKGKGWLGVDRLRGDQREDVAFEIFAQPCQLVLRQPVDRREHDAFFEQQRAQRFEAFLLAVFEREQLAANRLQLLARAGPVDRLRLDPALDLSLQPGDADHRELVEIARRNRQEPQPLE